MIRNNDVIIWTGEGVHNGKLGIVVWEMPRLGQREHPAYWVVLESLPTDTHFTVTAARGSDITTFIGPSGGARSLEAEHLMFNLEAFKKRAELSLITTDDFDRLGASFNQADDVYRHVENISGPQLQSFLNNYFKRVREISRLKEVVAFEENKVETMTKNEEKVVRRPHADKIIAWANGKDIAKKTKAGWEFDPTPNFNDTKAEFMVVRRTNVLMNVVEGQPIVYEVFNSRKEIPEETLKKIGSYVVVKSSESLYANPASGIISEKSEVYLSEVVDHFTVYRIARHGFVQKPIINSRDFFKNIVGKDREFITNGYQALQILVAENGSSLQVTPINLFEVLKKN